MLRDALSRIGREIKTAREGSFASNPLAEFIRGAAAREVETALGELARGLTCKGSAGAGKWADAGLAADQVVSATPQHAATSCASLRRCAPDAIRNATQHTPSRGCCVLRWLGRFNLSVLPPDRFSAPTHTACGGGVPNKFGRNGPSPSLRLLSKAKRTWGDAS